MVSTSGFATLVTIVHRHQHKCSHIFAVMCFWFYIFEFQIESEFFFKKSCITAWKRWWFSRFRRCTSIDIATTFITAQKCPNPTKIFKFYSELWKFILIKKSKLFQHNPELRNHWDLPLSSGLPLNNTAINCNFSWIRNSGLIFLFYFRVKNFKIFYSVFWRSFWWPDKPFSTFVSNQT